MPAKSINLLPHRSLDQTMLGKFLRWSLTYGRYIIICTEIIVLMAFIYRFSLDRRLTDLNEEVDQKSAIVKANLGFENRFRNLQSRVEQIAGLFDNQDLVLTVIHHLEVITPSGIHLTSFSFLPQSISINAVANDSASLALFLQNLKRSTILTKINISQLTKKNTGAGESLFQIDAQINEVPIAKPISQVNP